MGRGTGPHCVANVDTCQSRLGLFGDRSAQSLMLRVFSQIKYGSLGSQITGLPLMSGGREPKKTRWVGGLEKERGLHIAAKIYIQSEYLVMNLLGYF